jgi:hypothetical protein
MVVLGIVPAGLFWVSAGTKTNAPTQIAAAPLPQETATPQKGKAPREDNRSRLTIQPEAAKLGRAVGQRLSGHSRTVSVMTGVLTVGTDEQKVRIQRRQDDDGESIEVTAGNRHEPLTWSAEKGAGASGDALTDDERFLVEKLTLDSPDQFVLAQLRGASYYTVARLVRPTEAGDSDNYSGPLWNIVRVTEPIAAKREGGTQSSWRLYYINCATGLIDRIVSEEGGEQVTAEITDWSEVNGEKLPAHIRWTKNGQTLMEFRLKGFSHGPQQQQ